MSFGGHRDDHFDMTPTTPDDTRIMLRANGGLQNWMAIPVEIELPDGRWVVAGCNTRMHGSRQGGGNPGVGFPSRSDLIQLQSKPGTWDIGGHVCVYLINSTGGAGESANRHARAEANRLAENGTRGRNSRAAAYEAWFRAGGTHTTAPPINIIPVSYAVQITTRKDPLQVRSEPSTARGSATVIGSVPRLSRQNVTGETTGPGASKWLRIVFGGAQAWISADFTHRIADLVPIGTFSVQFLASRNQADVDKAIARLTASGFDNAYYTYTNGWNQARIGPYTTREAALATKPRLTELGYKDAFLIRNE
jgi:hypothetical protein